MTTVNQMVAFALLSLLLLTNQLLVAGEDDNLALESNDNDGSSGALAESNQDAHLKQSELWPSFLWPTRAREKPNIFLIGLKPYRSVLPKPVLDLIDTQIRPQTDDLSAQILSNVPGAEQVYQQVSDFLDMFSNLVPQDLLGGGDGGGSGSNSNGSGSAGNLGLSSLMAGFGRRL